MNRLALVVVALLAFVALGVTYGKPAAVDFSGRWVKGGLWVGTSTDTANKVTSSLGGSLVFNFPFDAGCQDSPAISVPSASLGDPCMVGATVQADNSAFTCYVSTSGNVKVRQCPSLVDAADAGFWVRVVSSQ